MWLLNREFARQDRHLFSTSSALCQTGLTVIINNSLIAISSLAGAPQHWPSEPIHLPFPAMFAKHFEVDPQHIDFQGVVDGLYYPFYMEWTRHAFMKEALGIDIEEEFKQGKIYMVLEYSLRFRKSLQKGDQMEVTCELQKHEKRNRVNFFQQIKVNDVVYADATFVATCFVNGRPFVPEAIAAALV